MVNDNFRLNQEHGGDEQVIKARDEAHDHDRDQIRLGDRVRDEYQVRVLNADHHAHHQAEDEQKNVLQVFGRSHHPYHQCTEPDGRVVPRVQRVIGADGRVQHFHDAHQHEERSHRLDDAADGVIGDVGG